ncbi:MAG: YceD family protein [Alphaproteobacteria bacterium]
MSEFSRPLPLRKIKKQKTKTSKITATPEECAALVERLGLFSVASLEATYTVQKKRAGIFVEGTLLAKVTQTCVSTLENFDSEIEADFEEAFTDREPEGDTRNIDLNTEAFEPITGDTLDIGEVVVQNLSVNLDPYPRKDTVV